MKILLTAIGKRVQLIQHLKTVWDVVGVDRSQEVAAREFVDTFYTVSAWQEAGYVAELIHICKKENVQLLIPLYEKEFLVLARARKQFQEIGVTLLLSGEPILSLCNDKIATSRFFEQHQVPHPKRYEEGMEITFPAIIKPTDGMGSYNVFKVETEEALDFFKAYVENPMVESLIEGIEYTIDVLCDLVGMPIYIVPRVRLEVRSGEVTKTKTIQDDLIIKETENLLTILNQYKKEEGIGLVGPLTIQCFKTKENSVIFLEINPRFGGGVPLSFIAGADYATRLKEMLEGETMQYIPYFREMQMLRYDQAVFKEVINEV